MFLLGPLAGFSIFLINVATLGGVFFRPDDKGKQRFTLSGFIEFLKAPFSYGTTKFETVWGLFPDISFISKLKMLMLNWILLVGIGTLSSFIYLYYT